MMHEILNNVLELLIYTVLLLGAFTIGGWIMKQIDILKIIRKRKEWKRKKKKL